MAGLARSLNADEVQLNTPLRSSRTPPLSQKEMAEIETAFIGLPVTNVYTAKPPATVPLDDAETRSRRPAEAYPETKVGPG